MASNSGGFARYAWGVLAYNIAVILWGALVRATSSGAGCGGHWPLCNGELLPSTAVLATRIEFTHRMMSGAALAAIVVLFFWARRTFTAEHPARKWANWSLVLILTEALLGAALVLFGYVAKDQSVGRIYSLSLHLMNTFALLAALALTARWASLSPPNTTAPRDMRMWFALAAVILVAVAGAITALGDTLFPAASLAAGMRADFSSEANFLVRLRIFHPALAVAAAIYLATLAIPEMLARRSAPLRNLAIGLMGLVVLQMIAGAANLLLRAPLMMQLTHLLIADSVWIALILFASEKRRLV